MIRFRFSFRFDWNEWIDIDIDKWGRINTLITPLLEFPSKVPQNQTEKDIMWAPVFWEYAA